MGDLLILGVLAVIVFAILRKLVRDKRSGKTCCTGCSGNCGSGPYHK